MSFYTAKNEWGKLRPSVNLAILGTLLFTRSVTNMMKVAVWIIYQLYLDTGPCKQYICLMALSIFIIFIQWG